MFTAALFTRAKIQKQTKCSSMDEWINKMQCMYVIEYCSALKKEF